MKAIVSHISLNPRGGAERLAVSAIRALSGMGYAVELCTFDRPDDSMMADAYGEPLRMRVSKFSSLRFTSSLVHPGRDATPGIHVNTHGDMLPLYRECFSKSNSIVYCHYPIAGCLIDSEDPDYCNQLNSIKTASLSEHQHQRLLETANTAYGRMLANSTVITNSEFSRKAIAKLYGVNSAVISPPVDTELFRQACLSSSEKREDQILVISRFHRSKKVENAIRLASMLRRRNIGRRMVLVGNVSPDGTGYLEYLRRMAKDLGVGDYVKFEPSARFARLVDLMRRSKVYLHPLPGEPFGISTVESMSAGLIPVVPDVGGHTEFVPRRYQFHTFDEGADAVSSALAAQPSEKVWMSNSASAFSEGQFASKFQQLVCRCAGEVEPVAPSGKLFAAPRVPSADSAA